MLQREIAATIKGRKLFLKNLSRPLLETNLGNSLSIQKARFKSLNLSKENNIDTRAHATSENVKSMNSYNFPSQILKHVEAFPQ